MIEKKYVFSLTNEKIVERVIADEFVHLNHVVLKTNDKLPEHYSNANVYLTITKGVMSATLNEQENHKYEAGTIIQVPINTKMNIANLEENILEFFITKAPAPTK